MLIKSRKPAAPPVDPLTQTRADAETHRRAAAAARAEADVTVSAARAQAERLVADAEQHARKLTADANAAEKEAARLDERAGYLAHAEALRGEIPGAEEDIVRLATEADGLREQADGLGRRLAELGEQREQTGVQLATARERGDVEAVTELRGRLAAVDEVVAVLQGQQQAAQDRLTAVGDADGTGELGAAARRWQRLQADLRAVLNWLDPNRPEAVQDRLVADLQMALAANVQRIAEETAPPAPTHDVVVRTH